MLQYPNLFVLLLIWLVLLAQAALEAERARLVKERVETEAREKSMREEAEREAADLDVSIYFTECKMHNRLVFDGG